jgi:hypothetical protein
MGGIFSVISKLFWGEAKPVAMEQMNVDEGVREMEQLVAQVSDLKNGEYVHPIVIDVFYVIHIMFQLPMMKQARKALLFLFSNIILHFSVFYSRMKEVNLGEGKVLLCKDAAGEISAIGSKCTHYAAPLKNGVRKSIDTNTRPELAFFRFEFYFIFFQCD